MTKIISLFFATCLIVVSTTSAIAHETAVKAPAPAMADSFTLVVNTELLSGLARTEVTAATHEEAPSKWEGVALFDVLRKANAPVDAKLRGKALTTLIRVTAADGYQIIFSLAELDAGFANAKVLLADMQNGQALSAETGPFRLVVPGDKRAGRWIRNVQTIELLDAGSAMSTKDKK